MAGTFERIVYAISLPRVRRQLRRRWVRPLAAGIAAAYGLGSMLIGQMLVFEPVRGSSYITVVESSGGYRPWDYPALFVQQPWGLIQLPFLPTITMLLVSAGVGVGLAAGISLAFPRLFPERLSRGRTSPTVLAAGVGPAVSGLATLGACCCAGCVGATGLTVVAAASGTDLLTLLLNDWYVGVFQVGVVFVSLLALDRSAERPVRNRDSPKAKRMIGGALLRTALLVSGITWSLAMLVEWSEVSPLAASGETWYHWIFEHQALSVVAIVAGLFPQETIELIRNWAHRWPGRGFRLLIGISAVSWGIWVPPGVASVGLGGLVNELLGFWGAPASWGAMSSDAPMGAALYFHWIFQHAILSAFALGVAAFPGAVSRFLESTITAAAPESTPGWSGHPGIGEPTSSSSLGNGSSPAYSAAVSDPGGPEASSASVAD